MYVYNPDYRENSKEYSLTFILRLWLIVFERSTSVD